MDGAMSANAARGLRVTRAGVAATAAGLGLYCAASHAAETRAQVDVIELRQTESSLRETYAKGKRMGLPRM